MTVKEVRSTTYTDPRIGTVPDNGMSLDGVWKGLGERAEQKAKEQTAARQRAASKPADVKAR